MKKGSISKYKVLAALKEDINQGWVWVQDESVKLQPRSIVKITNKENRKSIFCECLVIDNNFTKSYNNQPRVHINDEPTIIMNEWYRSKLGGIKTQGVHNLCIESENNLFGHFRANFGHPQTIVRMSMWLGTIGVILGVIGLFLGITGKN